MNPNSINGDMPAPVPLDQVTDERIRGAAVILIDRFGFEIDAIPTSSEAGWMLFCYERGRPGNLPTAIVARTPADGGQNRPAFGCLATAKLQRRIFALLNGPTTPPRPPAGVDLRLATALADARFSARLTQSQLAEKIGKTKGWISQIEKGRRPASLKTVAAWAVACDWDPHDLDPRLASSKP